MYLFSITVRDDQSFILTTDADVKFTHESMEALIDQITQDSRVGAVCARTHPLGSGPMVWYQVFDYAIGHWFQKVFTLICATLGSEGVHYFSFTCENNMSL